MTKVIIFILLFVSHGMLWAEPYQGELIDAFTTVDHEVKDFEVVIRLMEKAGVGKTLLSLKGTTGKGRGLRGKHAEFAAQFPDKVVPLIKIMSKHYRKNRLGKMDKKLDKWLGKADYKGMGDLKVYDRRGSGSADQDHDPLIVKLNEERVNFFVKTAQEHQWPFILNLPLRRIPEPERGQYMQDLENLLSNNAEVNVVLTGLGQLELAKAQELLKRHKNLYLYVSRCSPAYLFDESYTQIFDLKAGQEFVLNDEWKQVLNRFSDRFLVATVNTSALDWDEKFYMENIAWARKALGELAPEAADRVAHGNARRLWNL